MRHRGPAVAFAVLLAISALRTPAWAASPSAEDEPDTLTCTRHGTLTFEPGLTTTHKEFTLSELGLLGSCVGSDGSMLIGLLRASGGYGTGTCAGVYISDAPFSVEWSDGTTSSGRALFSTIGPVTLGIGEITSGHFAGKQFSSRPMLVPHNPERCASDGVTTIDYHGEVVFE